MKDSDQIRSGFKNMSRSRAVVCGLARDCSRTLPHLIQKLEKLGACFSDCRYIVVENDSRDQTAHMLNDWAVRNRAVNLISFSLLPETVGGPASPVGLAGDYTRARISRMAFARNLYLDRLAEWSNFDVVIIVDLDIHDFSLSGIAHSFGTDAAWDCMASFSRRWTPRRPFRRSVYWDTFAYEPEAGFEAGRQTYRNLRKAHVSLAGLLAKTTPLPAKSAFGGLAIYQAHCLDGARYAVLDNASKDIPVLCEHVAFHRAIRERMPFELMINARQSVLYERFGSVLKRLLRISS